MSTGRYTYTFPKGGTDAAKSWPAVLHGQSIEAPTVHGETVDELIASMLGFYVEGEDRAEALADTLPTLVNNRRRSNFTTWLNQPIRGQKEGEKAADVPRQSSVVTLEECREWFANWAIEPNQRKTGGTSEAARRAAAESRAEAAEASASAMHSALEATLMALPAKAREATLKQLKDDGMLPSDFEL